MNGGNSASQMTIEKLVGTITNIAVCVWRPTLKDKIRGILFPAMIHFQKILHSLLMQRRKWKIKCGKALFAPRTLINKEYIDHVRELDSPKEIWNTLEDSVVVCFSLAMIEKY
uniref:Uncharacterized protein n=1 Tax=Nelumbo nucifera TaxID=4432 RepID=A0A822Z917_NELNU|nr:TPA_asm: hypothetical protein HUJ06_015393 [Nelumbo nucifera]